MAREGEVHATSASMVQVPLPEVDAGSDITLKVRVSCSSTCDLQGGMVRVVGDEGVVVDGVELVSFDGAANETDDFVVKAPPKAGEFTWTAVFAAQDKSGVLHEGSSTSFSFAVKPHRTSIAVWDVPSPVVFNTRFAIKAGVRCSTECDLAGKEVEIYDHQGIKVATSTLGDVRWSGTTGLYWTEVELEAPSSEGYYTWAAKFPKPDLELSHEGASYTFAFGTARQPDHVVTVEVLDKATTTPIEHADVILHPYRGYSDERGVSRLMVPKGEYDLYVSAADKQTFQTRVVVDRDVSVTAELLVAVIPEPFA